MSFILRRDASQERASLLRGFYVLVTYIGLSFFWTLTQTLSQVAGFPLLAEEVWRRLLHYELFVLALLFLDLTRSFLRLEGDSRLGWGLGCVWLMLGVLLYENLLDLPELLWSGAGLTIRRQPAGQGLLLAGWVAALGAAAWLTVRAYYQTQQPLHRNRIIYWLIALGLTLGGALLVLTQHHIIGSAAYLVGVSGAAYVMLTHRLPDIRQRSRQALSYLIMTALTMLIYAIGILASQAASQSSLGLTPFLIVGLVALTLAIVFDPLLRLIQRLVNQLISGVSYDTGLALREYSATISNILDLERLATVALGLITRAVGIRRGALFIVRRETLPRLAPADIRPNGVAQSLAQYDDPRPDAVRASPNNNGNNGHKSDAALTMQNTARPEPGEEAVIRLQGVIGVGAGLPPGVQLPTGLFSAQSLFVDYLSRERQPLAQYDIDLLPRFKNLAPQERAWLAGLNMDIYVPIWAKGEWIGLFTFGPKNSGDRYFDQDLNLISGLADQTAVALENARLFDDLKLRNQEIEHLNHQLTTANQQLARLDQAKSNFIGVASHELRTPLTHIRGYNDMLSDMIETGGLTPEGGLKMTQAVSKGVKRLEAIVNTMFDVSKIDTQTLDLSAALMSINSVVHMAAELWREALQERRQTLTIENLESLPAIIGDSQRLQQVFSNLLQNAIKFTPDGGQIHLSGRLLVDQKIQPPQENIEIIMADTGIGIASEELERLFEKFYRVGSADLHSTGQTKFKGAGPGLGLTVAKGIVEAHGGLIWAESPGYDEENCPGSEFHVVLPVRSTRLQLVSSEAFMAHADLVGEKV
jgi:signal transduction histidine kinase